MTAQFYGFPEERDLVLHNNSSKELLIPTIPVSMRYALFIKQFIVRIAFVKFIMIVHKKTDDTLEFMKTTPLDPTYYAQVYETTLSECMRNDCCEIWDEVFGEHNIEVALQYYMTLIHRILTYSGNDPAYTYSPESVRRKLYPWFVHVYPPKEICDSPSTSVSHKMYNEFLAREQSKRIRNSIIYDVFSTVNQQSPHSTESFCPQPCPFYAYLKQFKKHAPQCFVQSLEITEETVSKYLPYSELYCELYTIWLIQLCLK
jgi:hypothetical protein